jgi:hypothetical protein
VGFVSIVSGRNPKEGKGTEAHKFKNWDSAKPLIYLAKTPFFGREKRWW